jgi:hypothetical protein
MIKVSNIMGFDPKPFDPKTYVEEDTFVTDESGSKKRIRLENNIVRWRTVRNPDGTTSVSDYLLLLSVIHTHMHNRVVKHNYSYKERQKSNLL